MSPTAQQQKTELAPVDTGFVALSGDKELTAALAANTAGEPLGAGDLTHVPTPSGGATQWRVEELEGEKYYPAISGVLVFYGPGGALWPSYDPKPGTMPVLTTTDLVDAHRVGDLLGDIDPKELARCERSPGSGVYDWRKLKYTQFGSGKNGRGKRAKEYRTLCVLRKDDVFPLLIRAQSGSLATVVPFIKRLTNARIPYFRAVVELTLKKVENAGGQPYAQIVPRLVGTLSAEQGEIVRRLYTDPLSSAVRQAEINLDEGEE